MKVKTGIRAGHTPTADFGERVETHTPHGPH